MAKKAFKIESFEGGINQKADARDINDNQFEELFNADVSRKGRIVMPGNALSVYSTVNVKSETVFPEGSDFSLTTDANGVTPGYGLFAFSHDYNMQGSISGESNPNELETEFLCINDGAHIDIWDSCHNTDGTDLWIQSAMTLGNVHIDSNDKKVKPVYYKVDNGLRACDANFSEKDSGITCSDGGFGINDNRMTTSPANHFTDNDVGLYIRINSEIMKIHSVYSGTVVVLRGQFGTKQEVHADDSIIYNINIPKVLSHIKRPILKNTAEGGGSINTWKEDTQSLESPLDALTSSTSVTAGYAPKGLVIYDGKITAMSTEGTEGTDINDLEQEPNTSEKVLFSIHESNSANDNIVEADGDFSSEGTVINGLGTINLIAASTVNFAAKGFTVGKFVIVTGSTHLDGLHEIVANGANTYTIQVSGEFNTAETSPYFIRLEENHISEDLANKYVFGMSYIYDGGGSEVQESPIKMGYLYNGLITHNAAIFKTNDEWITGNSITATASPTASTTSTFYWEDGLNFDGDVASENMFLRYRDTTDPIIASTKYKIALDVELSGGAILRVHSPGLHTTNYGDLGDDNLNYISLNETGTYLISATTHGTITAENVFVAEAVDGSGDKVKIRNVQVFKDVSGTNPQIMSATNAIDMRGWEGIPKMFSSFNMSTNASYNWNERIAGYKIYMKQVDSTSGTLSSEWLLALKVDFETGEYTNYTNDNIEQTLSVSDTWSSSGSAFLTSSVCTVKDDSDVNGLSAMDTMRNIPLDTYQSENGYEAETNTAAMYKTSATINRKTFIGNLKIGSKTYPDRMI